MLERGLGQIRLLLLIPIKLPDAITLLIGGVAAFLLAFLLTFFVKAFCYKVGWLDKPAARRVHTKAVPRLGGVAIYLAFVIASLFFYTPGPNLNAHANELTIYWLLIVAGALLVLVHAYDDILGLGPWPKLIAQTMAVIIILGPWIDRTFHGILLFTFNNPFGVDHFIPNLPWYREPTLFLVVQNSDIALAAIPAILLTWFWTVGMMNTVNWIDGMDGLATGVVGITALFITLISFMLHQYSIAVLSAIFTGAVFGFLPHNWNPAKIFMGDTGSMFLGLALAVLSIMGGAKLALALMVLGVPILDVALVIINRIRRGQSLSFSGIHAAHFYKFVGIVLAILTMFGLIIWVDYRQRLRGVPIKLGRPEISPNDSNEQTPIDSVPESMREEPSEYKAKASPPQSHSTDEHVRTPLLQ